MAEQVLAAVTREGSAEAMPTKTKKKCVSCDECYFRKNMLCALDLDSPCPTFRSAERGLAPERQLSFVFRTERTRSAYAFPQAAARA
jgi:hypothetical protein